MIIVVVAMSIAGAVYLVQWGVSAGWPIPPVLLQPIVLPRFIYSMPGLAFLLLKVVSVNYLAAYAAVSLVLILVLGGLVSIVYGYLYQSVAPPRYGPLDSPPLPRKAGQRKR